MSEEGEIVPTARSNVYRFLAFGFGYPNTCLLSQLNELLPQLEASLDVLGDRGSLAAARAIGSVLKALTADDLQASYLRCFGHTISKDCPPYETEYGQAHIFEKSQSLADIAGFYRAFGLDLAPNLSDRLDHVSVELEFMQFLCTKEAYALARGHAQEKLALCRDAQAKFLGEHLGCWAFGFSRKLEKKAGHSVHGLVAEILTSFLTCEMQAFGLELGAEAVSLLQEPLEEETAGCQTCAMASPVATVEQGGLP
jgi:DMSO reductase family type II enzyme chaperone